MNSTDICPELLVMQPALVVSKRFLGSVFNQHIAVMLIISGNLT